MSTSDLKIAFRNVLVTYELLAEYSLHDELVNRRFCEVTVGGACQVRVGAAFQVVVQDTVTFFRVPITFPSTRDGFIRRLHYVGLSILVARLGHLSPLVSCPMTSCRLAWEW
jgi:hypothetical protein